MKRRVLSLALTVGMIFSMMPGTAFAQEETPASGQYQVDEESEISESTAESETQEDENIQNQLDESESDQAVVVQANETAVQANAGEKDVATLSDFRAALKDDSIQIINITGNITYSDPLSTSKTICVKNGSTFKWSAYKDTLNVSQLTIENGGTFDVSPFDFMSSAVVSGKITNNGSIKVISTRGQCFWTAVTQGSGTFSTTSDTYISYGTVPSSMFADTNYKINVLKDLSVAATVSLPETMYVGDTITPVITNIIDGVDLAAAFKFQWKNASSFTVYDDIPSPTLTKSGTLKLTLSAKKPYVMKPNLNSYSSSLDATGTVQKKLVNIVYVDAVNGNNQNIGDKRENPVKTLQTALENVEANGTVVLLNDYSGAANLDKSVTIKSDDGHTYKFAPSTSYTFISGSGVTVSLDSVVLDNLTIGIYDRGATDSLNIVNCTGSIQATNQYNTVTDLRVMNSNISGTLTANRLELVNTILSGRFLTEQLAVVGNNTLVPVKNSPSRVTGAVLEQDTMTVSMTPEKGQNVIEVTGVSEEGIAGLVSVLQLSDTQDGKYILRKSKKYNGTYIAVSQRADDKGNLIVANEPWIGEKVEDSYATFRNEDSHVVDAVWSGYTDTVNNKWSADDVPELTVTLGVWSADGSGSESKHFDDTFGIKNILVYSWENIEENPVISEDTLNSNVEILVKEGQGLSADKQTYTFTVRYPAVERLDQSIVTDCTQRSAYCTQVLGAREVTVLGNAEISYESTHPEIASVDVRTGEITAHEPGTTEIIVKSAQTDMYKAAEVRYTLTVDHADVIAPTVVENLTYNANPQALVNAGSTPEGKIMYKVGDRDWQEEVPTATDAGTYIVYYKAVRGEGHGETEATALEVTIAKKKILATITPNGGTYNGEIVPATVVLNGLDGIEQPEVTLTYQGTAYDGTQVNTTEVPKLAGTYTVTATVSNPNYSLEVYGATATFIVQRAGIKDVQVILENTLKYTGEAQTQKIKIMLNGQEVPADAYEITGNTATEAGTYTMTITAKENSNFTGSLTWTYTIEAVKDDGKKDDGKKDDGKSDNGKTDNGKQDNGNKNNPKQDDKGTQNQNSVKTGDTFNALPAVLILCISFAAVLMAFAIKRNMFRRK